MDKVPMTASGLAALEEELMRLREERPLISKAIGVAREHGDISENAEYHAAKERQGMVEARLKELEGVVSYAEVIDPSKLSGDVVKFGATVRVADESTDKESTYQIVGSYEADAAKGTLSVTAPLARALIGKTVGDSVEVVAPGGAKFYEIVEVTFK
ncbi:MAG: transcription elongation factor GreA [Proteobacteria bacterium]|nr:transcription elongation factor GreA [Pseudomonadota bacterium]